MNGSELQEVAAFRTNELPGTELTHPFGEAWDVWKVRGKVFMLHTDLSGDPIITLKSSPPDARALRESHPSITAGYHMNKRHWITLRAGQEIDRQFVEDLVTESYLLVIEGLPKRLHPVNPETFGR